MDLRIAKNVANRPCTAPVASLSCCPLGQICLQYRDLHTTLLTTPSYQQAISSSPADQRPFYLVRRSLQSLPQSSRRTGTSLDDALCLPLPTHISHIPGTPTTWSVHCLENVVATCNTSYSDEVFGRPRQILSCSCS